MENSMLIVKIIAVISVIICFLSFMGLITGADSGWSFFISLVIAFITNSLWVEEDTAKENDARNR